MVLGTHWKAIRLPKSEAGVQRHSQGKTATRKSQHQHRPEPDPNRELIQESGRDFKTNEEVKEETKANATEMSKSCRKSG